MKILVTGKDGQVVRSLQEKAAARPDIELIALGRPELDLSDPASVEKAILAAAPDLVVSAAAYTAVDQAEDEPELAYAVNASGAEAVAQAANQLGIPVIHISTDYVFAGDGEGAYSEDDTVGPQGVYGQTKLDGERLVAATNPKHVILRTAWVYSPFGKNFVKTMLKLAETRDSLTVVADQWGNPTNALDIADGILRVADHLAKHPDFDGYGIYHFVGAGDVNWSGFARAIFEESGKRNGPTAQVGDIPSSAYPTKAKRPANSRLSINKFQKTFDWKVPAWQGSLAQVVDRLLSESR